MAEISVIPERTRPVKLGVRQYLPGDEQGSKGSDMETWVSERYTCVKREDVQSFLRVHPQIAQTLMDAIPKIEEFFGEGTAVSLRVPCDQESDPSLSANIRTRLEVSEARAARKAFNVSWWMHQPDMDELPLTFNIEYI